MKSWKCPRSSWKFYLLSAPELMKVFALCSRAHESSLCSLHQSSWKFSLLSAPRAHESSLCSMPRSSCKVSLLSAPRAHESSLCSLPPELMIVLFALCPRSSWKSSLSLGGNSTFVEMLSYDDTMVQNKTSYHGGEMGKFIAILFIKYIPNTWADYISFSGAGISLTNPPIGIQKWTVPEAGVFT